MSDQGSTATATAPKPPSPQRRRSSFAELFANRPPNDPSSIMNSMSVGSTSPRPARPSQSYMFAATSGDNFAPSQQSAGSASSAQQIHPRRLSITTLGLSGSPTRSAAPASATSPFGTYRRGQSISETDPARSYDNYESAVADEVDGAGVDANSPPRNSPPFARRVSFGAKAAYRDMRASSVSGASGGVGGGGGGVGGTNGNGGSRSPSNGSIDPLSTTTSNESSNGSNGITKISTSPPSVPFKERFNWSENIRARAERSSISSGAGVSFGSAFGSSNGGARPGHSRTASTSGAVMTGASTAATAPGPGPGPGPGPAAPAPAPVPKAAPVYKTPDHFQERILKGDFYMD